MSEPNTLTKEQNDLLNQHADVLMRKLSESINHATELANRDTHAVLTSLILLAYVTDEEWLKAQEAAKHMMDIEFQGSIKEFVDNFMPRPALEFNRQDYEDIHIAVARICEGKVDKRWEVLAKKLDVLVRRFK